MTSRRSTKPAPRERLLATATELFSRFGIRAVGIDRILRQAGVAKASLYNTYGSKDGLVVAYLRALQERDRELWDRRVAGDPDPRHRILSLFDLVRERVDPVSPCACHLSAAIEFPEPDTEGEHAIRSAVADQRAWILDTIRANLQDLGLQDPENIEDLAARLALLHDGAVTTARLGSDLSRAASARDMAALVLDVVSDPE